MINNNQSSYPHKPSRLRNRIISKSSSTSYPVKVITNKKELEKHDRRLREETLAKGKELIAEQERIKEIVNQAKERNKYKHPLVPFTFSVNFNGNDVQRIFGLEDSLIDELNSSRDSEEVSFYFQADNDYDLLAA